MAGHGKAPATLSPPKNLRNKLFTHLSFILINPALRITRSAGVETLGISSPLWQHKCHCHLNSV